ncbi:TRAP transporter large permease [Moorella sulfitireducens]|uniref:TRAP transporter large permease n=1 Tax=Neomoorella sulfitireducens TaxID=2972948 RepID=UPI0021ACC5FE|nr:TRAP transporter large permease subunit [Moorella sulfitireducens]
MMGPEIVGAIGLVVLVVLLFSGIWIGAAMALVGFFGYASIMGFGPAFRGIPQILFTTVGDYPMSAVPLFVFMGMLLSNTEIGKDLYESAYKLVGQLRGGLAMATVVACALFAAITGVPAPALATMGKVALPEMKKYNYDEKLSVGSIACAAPLAFVIPPSMSFIIYGILTENSIGLLFMAGIIPGILLTLLYCLVIAIITARNPQAGPPGPKTSFKEKVLSLKGTWHMILLFVLMLGGIYGGIFTPTEAGAIGGFGAVLIGLSNRRLTLKKILDALFEAGQTTAMVMLLIVGAYIFMKFMAVSKLPILLGEIAAQLPVPKMVIFTGIVVLYLILGMFLDIFSAVILTMPIIYPVALSLGFDPIWFGVVITLVIVIGVITPPVGLDCFVFSGLTGIPLSTVFSSIIPFFIADIICIIIVSSFPQLSLFIPRLMQ